MPLYEYQCKKCGHKFEKIQLFSDAPIKKCPECGGAVEKLISRSAVQFKGSGWYVTDYAKKSDGGSGSKPASDSTTTPPEGGSSDARETKAAKPAKPEKKAKK